MKNLEELERWRQRLKDLERPVEAPEDFLAAQRREILGRLEHPHPRVWRWAPALAAAGLVIAGLFALRPGPRPEIPDAKFFAEISAIEQSPAPRVARPISALFEEPKK